MTDWTATVSVPDHLNGGLSKRQIGSQAFIADIVGTMENSRVESRRARAIDAFNFAMEVVTPANRAEIQGLWNEGQYQKALIELSKGRAAHTEAVREARLARAFERAVDGEHLPADMRRDGFARHLDDITKQRREQAMKIRGTAAYIEGRAKLEDTAREILGNARIRGTFRTSIDKHVPPMFTQTTASGDEEFMPTDKAQRGETNAYLACTVNEQCGRPEGMPHDAQPVCAPSGALFGRTDGDGVCMQGNGVLKATGEAVVFIRYNPYTREVTWATDGKTTTATVDSDEVPIAIRHRARPGVKGMVTLPGGVHVRDTIARMVSNIYENRVDRMTRRRAMLAYAAQGNHSVLTLPAAFITHLIAAHGLISVLGERPGEVYLLGINDLLAGDARNPIDLGTVKEFNDDMRWGASKRVVTEDALKERLIVFVPNTPNAAAGLAKEDMFRGEELTAAADDVEPAGAAAAAAGGGGGQKRPRSGSPDEEVRKRIRIAMSNSARGQRMETAPFTEWFSDVATGVAGDGKIKPGELERYGLARLSAVLTELREWSR